MLLPQRKVLYFSIIIIIIFLSSCIPPTATYVEETSSANVTIPVSCFAENTQTYIASDGTYCFAYPFGYIVGNQSSPNFLSFTQAIVGNIPATNFEDVENMDDLLRAIPGGTTLVIHYEDRHIDDQLQDLVYKYSGDFYTPWVISGKEAILARALRENVVSYTIHVKNGDLYYQIVLSSLGGLTGNCTSSSDLEELFFLVSTTFTFLN